MNKLTVSCLLFLALTAIAVFAADRGTPDEAKAMLQKAIAHYKSVGRKQALADFNAKKPPFGDRDLYVVCIASDHTIVANGGFPQYVSMSADLMKDANGKSIGQAGYDLASSKARENYTIAGSIPQPRKWKTK
jgi:hypothetical protein